MSMNSLLETGAMPEVYHNHLVRKERLVGLGKLLFIFKYKQKIRIE